MTIQLNPRFYARQAILAGIRHFKPIGKIKFSEKKGLFFVSFKKAGKLSAALLADEFCNYILAKSLGG
jgi:hypothetical protein